MVLGKDKNLANILPNGDIKVVRFTPNQEIDFTIIRAKEFSLICGDCQNVIVYREPKLISPQVNIMLTWGTMLSYYANNT